MVTLCSRLNTASFISVVCESCQGFSVLSLAADIRMRHGHLHPKKNETHFSRYLGHIISFLANECRRWMRYL